MAKGRGRRDNFSPPIASPRLPVLSPSFRVTPTNWRQVLERPPGDLREVEDRRLFSPLGQWAPPKTVGGSAAHVTVKDRTPSAKQRASPFMRKVRSQTKAIVTFQEPSRVLVCIRRQRRKEVMHALKKAGRGGGRRPRRTPWSEVSCR